MLNLLKGLTETVVKVAALPVAVVADSTLIPFIAASHDDDNPTMTGKIVASIGKSIKKIDND
jgi:hypothetical protein